ncbi:MAG: hypothetical protein QGG53_04365 [Planctomycetota bacterium]|jgi:hypothetical protein|nr:hypothetical protein [Planctomycetota bacterium]
MNQTLLRIFLLTSLPSLLHAQERQGAFIAETEDEDGDRVIIMETDWISMRLMPAIGSTVTSFVFRPTQNEILEVVQPKNLKGGGGLLQDNVWEQDWRFQELRGKWYDYRITKRGPDEVQVIFETKLDGWINAKDSGIISKLLQDLKIRRTVTLRQGTPYFLFDVEFINEGKFTKLPLYWAHNSSRIDITAPDHVFRPSARGINHLPGKGQEYVYDFNHGWSARVSPTRKEGVVYLMDYDYISFLYNNQPKSPYTVEWIYDNLLILKKRPVKTRIYIIPTMGLEKVDHATEYFIAQLKPSRNDGQLRLNYKVTSSYEKASKITFVPELVHDLLGAEEKSEILSSMEFTELDIEPQVGEVTFEGKSSDPVMIRTKAFIDLADGNQVVREWEHFHIGSYSFGRNIRTDMRTPVKLLKRAKQDPFIPAPAEGLKVNREDFKVFGLIGANSRVLGIEGAIRSIQGAELEAGYHPGFMVYRTGLTDFPYDYERLFDFRCLVFNNAVFDVARFVGMSILTNYLENGGGLVYGGGENTFGLTKIDSAHPINEYLPIASAKIEKQTLQLNSPATEHPIFKDIDVSVLPYSYYYQKPEFKEKLASEPKILLKLGEHPFIIEYAKKSGQRVMLVMALPFGDPAENEGKQIFYRWSEWKKLYANIVRYASYDL